jgi:RNA polymerase sigma-70 factor (ECF subfamily)
MQIGITQVSNKKSSDEELVRAFVGDKDEKAFNEIVNRYGDKIYRLAMRATRNPNDAEDALQEVFITIIEKLGTFHEESKFSTWLYRVTANESYMHLRAEKKYKSDISLEEYVSYEKDGALKGVEMKDCSDGPDEVLQSKEAMEIIEKAVNGLPELSRIVFHLKDIEGLSNGGVAEVLGLSVPAVKSRIHRARLFLRDKLSEYFFEFRKGKQENLMGVIPQQ